MHFFLSKRRYIKQLFIKIVNYTGNAAIVSVSNSELFDKLLHYFFFSNRSSKR